jgi:O-methyltransferase
MNSADGPTPFILRFPGLRRYAIQLARLRNRLRSVEEELERHRDLGREARIREKELATIVADQRRQLEQARLSGQLLGGQEAETLQKALRFDYYWANASKKIDLRRLEGFGELAAKIREQKRTYLDLDRLYTLWQGVMTLPPDAAAIAEVGAYKGGSARFIAEALRLAGRELPFYVADTFEGHVEVDEVRDPKHKVATQFLVTSAERVARYLRDLTSIRLLVGDIRETSPAMQHETHFGLVHIDVDVYPITRFCLEFFATRLAHGALIVVDDYGAITCPGAKQAVDEFVAANPRFRRLHLLTGQAVLVST